MKKMFLLMVVLLVVLSGCLPAQSQPETINPTPISEADLQGTAAVISQQTLDSLPTATIAPSETPVVMTATETLTQAAPTETPNPVLLTLTATLGTGTVAVGNETPASGTAVARVSGTLITPSATANPAFSATPTHTAHPLFYGTLPPNLPFGQIYLVNKAKADVYISLRCVTKDGYITIIEYPVKSSVKTKALAGQYTYVAWVGGRQFTGTFSLSKGQELVINISKDKIGIR